MGQERESAVGYLPTVTGITVREALKLGALKRARVVAGHGGLDNVIRYVSVIEVPDAVRWFQGYELFITAAYCYRGNEDALVQLVEDLVCADASALAICYSQRYLGGIPLKVITRADELNLPVLELPLDVKYIEIITPVLTAIVNRQASYLDLALRAHAELENMVLKGQGLEAIVRKVAELLEVPVILLSPSLQVRCSSLPGGSPDDEVSEIDWRQALGRVQAEMEDASGVLVGEAGGCSFGAVLLGTERVRLGYLLALRVGVEEVRRLLLSQCALPVTIELLLEKTRQEAELWLHRDFFDDLFNGEMSSEVAVRRAKAYGIDLSGCPYVVVTDIDALAKQFLRSGEEDRIQGLKQGLKRLANTLVEMEAEGGLVASRSDSVVILPRFPGATKEEALARAKRLTQRLSQEAAHRLAPATISAGIGVFCADVGELARGFQTAQAAIEIGRRLHGPNSVHCWEELGPYRLLFAMRDLGEARAFVTQKLGALLELGNPRSEELLSTLDMVLACEG
ncbi:MAG TPA: hypothetical protein GX513_04900, partial [Firmicutes bacterium]|nr:hypothetical protein [Bacillota bacterium]